MVIKKNFLVHKSIILFVVGLIISACSPEVGSKEWCEDLADKPKGDWTVNEATDYTKHCIF